METTTEETNMKYPTPDEERVSRIKKHGLESLDRLHTDQTWEDWMSVGAAMEIITEEALAAVEATEWDPHNKRAINEFNRRWEAYEVPAGSNRKPLSKQERWALREVLSNPEIIAYRNSGELTGPEKRRLNHPNAVINRWRAREKRKATPAADKPLSPQAKLKQANIELQETLHQMKKHGDHNGFTKDDKNKDIATAIVGTFDGLSNKVTKVEGIVRELQAWLKEHKKQKKPAG